jgi:hypothetical protein
MSTDREHSGRTVAIVGGAGLLAWLLLRGGGVDKGRGTTPATRRVPGTRCVVWIRANRIEVDGVAADLPTVIARCRAVEIAEVHATGDAITGVVWNVLKALHATGVTIYTTPDLADVVPSKVLP